jgi:hypothetical protein
LVSFTQTILRLHLQLGECIFKNPAAVSCSRKIMQKTNLSIVALLCTACLTLSLPVAIYGQVFRGYYSSGALEFKSKKDNARRIIKGYYPGGALHFVSVYKFKKLHGITREYYENGHIKAEICYEDNLRDGESRFYYPTGVLMARIEYRKDQETGVWRLYDESGMLISTVSHKRRAKEKLTKFINDNTIIREIEKK